MDSETCIEMCSAVCATSELWTLGKSENMVVWEKTRTMKCFSLTAPVLTVNSGARDKERTPLLWLQFIA